MELQKGDIIEEKSRRTGAVYIRMLTLEEMLLIQGFPRDYKLIGTKANKTKFIGNSVPPVLARRLAEAGERALTQYIN